MHGFHSYDRIPVGNAQLLAKVQGENELLEEVPGHILLQTLARPRALVFYDILKHVPAGRKLHDNGQMLWRQENLPKLHDVGVCHAQAVIEDLSYNASADTCRRQRHNNVSLSSQSAAPLALDKPTA